MLGESHRKGELYPSGYSEKSGRLSRRLILNSKEVRIVSLPTSLKAALSLVLRAITRRKSPARINPDAAFESKVQIKRT